MASREGDNGQGGRDYSTGLRSGILDPRHYDAIGIALWTFVWCVDRQARDGRVLGGKLVTYARIASEVGLPSADAARYQIRRLVEGGYIAVEPDQSNHGMRIRILAPKKAYRTPSGVPAPEGTPPPASQHRRGTPRTPAQKADLTPPPASQHRSPPASQRTPPASQRRTYKEETHGDSETHIASKLVSTQRDGEKAPQSSPNADVLRAASQKNGNGEPVSREDAKRLVAEAIRRAQTAQPRPRVKR